MSALTTRTGQSLLPSRAELLNARIPTVLLKLLEHKCL